MSRNDLLLYIPTYGVKTLHLPAYTTFAATLVGGIILAVFSVIAGHYSDRIVSRRRSGHMAGADVIPIAPRTPIFFSLGS